MTNSGVRLWPEGVVYRARLSAPRSQWAEERRIRHPSFQCPIGAVSNEAGGEDRPRRRASLRLVPSFQDGASLNSATRGLFSRLSGSALWVGFEGQHRGSARRCHSWRLIFLGRPAEGRGARPRAKPVTPTLRLCRGADAASPGAVCRQAGCSSGLVTTRRPSFGRHPAPVIHGAADRAILEEYGSEAPRISSRGGWESTNSGIAAGSGRALASARGFSPQAVQAQRGERAIRSRTGADDKKWPWGSCILPSDYLLASWAPNNEVRMTIG